MLKIEEAKKAKLPRNKASKRAKTLSIEKADKTDDNIALLNLQKNIHATPCDCLQKLCFVILAYT